MIKRVKQTKVASVVLFLCAFIIAAYAYLYRSSIWQPKRTQVYHFPWNYTNKQKNITVQKKGPELQVTGLPLIILNQSQTYSVIENDFFKSLEQKDIICDDVVRHGNQHEGGWNVCMSPPFTLKKPCLVYSFGIGNDWRFEDDVHDRYGCRVMAYDPSIRLIEHNRTAKIQFKPLGLGASNGVSKEKWELKTLDQHLKDEGDSKAVISYLKFDIEYLEWKVIQNLFKDESLNRVKQLGIEIHLRNPLTVAPKDFMVSSREFVRKHRILQLLECAHFKEFSFRLNPFCLYTSKRTSKSRSYCYELNYLNLRFIQKKDLKPKT